MLTVVTWKWKQSSYRSSFGPKQVNTLHAMVKRHLHVPFEFKCITDDPVGIDPAIKIVPLWDVPRVVLPPGKPNCYRRLRAFAPEAAELIGPRFLSLDLDTVITGDITPLVERVEDFVIWGDTNPSTPYNGSMFLLSAGCRPQVWTKFDPTNSPIKTRNAGYIGSDQAWIGLVLGKNEARWTRKDGVYSFRNEIKKIRKDLPADARIIFFHGRSDPWDSSVQARYPWIKDHYRI